MFKTVTHFYHDKREEPVSHLRWQHLMNDQKIVLCQTIVEIVEENLGFLVHHIMSIH